VGEGSMAVRFGERVHRPPIRSRRYRNGELKMAGVREPKTRRTTHAIY
jgi:hypothetical protein